MKGKEKKKYMGWKTQPSKWIVDILCIVYVNTWLITNEIYKCKKCYMAQY